MTLAGTGGLPPQRPDQQRNYPPNGVQPGSSAGVVRARLVIVSGAGVSGVFVYNGTPGFGNPPIVSITNSSTDPYGNPVTPGLDVTQGSITGTTITGSTITGSSFDGTDFVIDTSGAFFYEGTPATGNLFVSITTADGTDSFGNAYQSGVQIHGTVPSYATPALVQHTAHNNPASVSTLVTTIPATAAGSGLIVCIGTPANNATVTSVLVGGVASNFVQVVASHAGEVGAEQWACPNAPAGSTTVTVNLSGVDNPLVDIFETSGLALSSVADQSNSGFSNGASAWSSGATSETTQAEEFVVGVMCGFDALFSGAAPAMTGPAGPWVNEAQQTINSWEFQLSGYQVASAEAAFTYAGTSNLASPNLVYGSCVATYKAALTGIVESGANIEMTTLGGVPFAFFSTGLAMEAASGFVQAVSAGSGATEILSLVMAGPEAVGFPDSANIFLNSSEEGGGATAVGILEYTDLTGAEHLWLGWGASGVNVFSAIVGDTNSYQVERLTQVRATDLVINTTGFSQEIFGSAAIGVGTYVVEGVLRLSATAAAGTPQFEFAGNTAVATMNIEFWEIKEGAPATLGNMGVVTAFAASFVGATMNAAGRSVQFRGLMVVTTAGLLGLFGATSVAADTFTISHTGSYMNVYPVGE